MLQASLGSPLRGLLVAEDSTVAAIGDDTVLAVSCQEHCMAILDSNEHLRLSHVGLSLDPFEREPVKGI